VLKSWFGSSLNLAVICVLNKASFLIGKLADMFNENYCNNSLVRLAICNLNVPFQNPFQVIVYEL
jgi:hypothetical protein